MLQAIKHNKIGQNIKGDLKWKDVFKPSEDSLTSSVIGSLLYLPVDIFWNLMRNACYTDELPKETGRLIEADFWAHWNSEGASNSNYVEPDVFIRFEAFDLLIEAKRYDNNQQSEGQWRDQIQAYLNEYSEDEKPLHYIALGGIRTEKPETIVNGNFSVNVIKCRWRCLLAEVKRGMQTFNAPEGKYFQNDAILRLFNDVIYAFRLHGFYTGEWLESMPYQSLNIENGIDCFVKHSIKTDGGIGFETLPTGCHIDSNSLEILNTRL